MIQKKYVIQILALQWGSKEWTSEQQTFTSWQFKWFAIQMPGTMVPCIWIVDQYSNGGLNTSPLTKWWSEYQTNHVAGHLNSKPFSDWTNPHDLNTKCYSDPHCIAFSGLGKTDSERWYREKDYKRLVSTTTTTPRVVKWPRTVWTVATVDCWLREQQFVFDTSVLGNWRSQKRSKQSPGNFG